MAENIKESLATEEMDWELYGHLEETIETYSHNNIGAPSLEYELHTLQESNERLQKEVDRVTVELEVCQRHKQQRDVEENRIREELAEKKTAINILQLQLQSTQSKLKSASEELQGKEAHINTLNHVQQDRQDELAFARSEIRDHEITVQRKEEANQALQSKLDGMEKTISEHLATIQQKQKQNEDLLSKIHMAQKEIANHGTTIRGLNVNVQTLKDRNVEVKQKLQSSLVRLQKTNRALEDKIEEMRSILILREGEINKRSNDISRLETERAKFESQIVKLDEELQHQRMFSHNHRTQLKPNFEYDPIEEANNRFAARCRWEIIGDAKNIILHTRATSKCIRIYFISDIQNGLTTNSTSSSSSIPPERNARFQTMVYEIEPSDEATKTLERFLPYWSRYSFETHIIHHQPTDTEDDMENYAADNWKVVTEVNSHALFEVSKPPNGNVIVIGVKAVIERFKDVLQDGFFQRQNRKRNLDYLSLTLTDDFMKKKAQPRKKRPLIREEDMTKETLN